MGGHDYCVAAGCTSRRSERRKFKQDCRKSKPILVGLRSCRSMGHNKQKRKRKEKETKEKSRKEEQKRKQRRMVDGLYFKMGLEKLLKSID